MNIKYEFRKCRYFFVFEYLPVHWILKKKCKEKVAAVSTLGATQLFFRDSLKKTS